VTKLSLGTVRALLIDLPVEELQLPASLTDSEREVVQLVAQGLSNEDIGKARGRSARTIANQLASVYRKLGVNSRTELLARLTGTDDRDAG
jgi:DNA-binding CsgD family transcriptional regulator